MKIENLRAQVWRKQQKCYKEINHYKVERLIFICGANNVIFTRTRHSRRENNSITHCWIECDKTLEVPAPGLGVFQITANSQQSDPFYMDNNYAKIEQEDLSTYI